METHRFCCVDCGKLLVHEEAAIMFRTGFFRIVFPLGYCKGCNNKTSVTASNVFDFRPGTNRTGGYKIKGNYSIVEETASASCV